MNLNQFLNPNQLELELILAEFSIQIIPTLRSIRINASVESD